MDRYIGFEELGALVEVIQSQHLWGGASEKVYQFEEAFGKHLGRKYVRAVSSGTAANEAALAALGLEPGDEVICPPCSFIASSMAIVSLGCVPVFADIDPRTLIISAESIEKRITPRTKAVVGRRVNSIGVRAEAQGKAKEM